MAKNYQQNLDKVNFFKRVDTYKSNLEILRENIIDVIELHDRKENPLSFTEIAEQLGLSSKSAAHLIYKANKPQLKKIKEYKIK